jgi:uncharacterized repeat protein (TIGR03803 family)
LAPLRLVVGLALILVVRVMGQTFTTLHSFSDSPDGAGPVAGLTLRGNTLYGTTVYGGSSSYGTVFAVNTDGTGFTNVYSFSALSGSLLTNSDGANPLAGLVLSNNALYGTTFRAGTSGYVAGTVFRVNTDGTAFTNLHSFTAISPPCPCRNNDGAVPVADLILSGNTLYGTASNGGSSGSGTVFNINTDDMGFTTLYTFTDSSGSPDRTNSDGASPAGGLVLSDNTLYGTANGGGGSGNGTVFRVNTDGTGFTNLHSFTTLNASSHTNGDGANPLYGGLTLSGNALYGKATKGGSSGNGTLFALNTDGTAFTNLHSFTGSDGAQPNGGLILSGNTLYGTAYGGGSSGKGTVFAVNTNGTGFKVLHNFTAISNSTNSDGANPQAGLILSGNTLYGTTRFGGSSSWGTLFSVSFAPQLTISRSGTNVILMWPTNAAGFMLQSTMNVVSPVWTTNSPMPLVVNGQYTVTNPIAATRQFFRLTQ